MAERSRICGAGPRSSRPAGCGWVNYDYPQARDDVTIPSIEGFTARGPVMDTIVIIIILLLLFGGFGGGYYGYSHYGMGGGVSVLGVVLIIVVVLFLFGRRR
jgi:hypothetical protein